MFHSEKRTYTLGLSFVRVGKFREFLELQQFSTGYVNQLSSYYRRYLCGRDFSTPMALERHINAASKGKRHLAKTARVYLNYCEKYETVAPIILEKYRKVLKLRTPQVDVYVPGDTEVKKAYNAFREDSVLELVFLVLATSGIRIVECLSFLENYDQERFKQHQGFTSYSLAYTRGSKNVNNVYLPDYVYKKLMHVNISYGMLQKRIRGKCSFSLRYLRKWNYNQMLYAGIPESVADFIQGRSGKTVSANHYLAKSQQAEHWYAKIVAQIMEVFHDSP